MPAPTGAATDPPCTAFRNTYWLLRHGRSYANEQDVIVSSPENGQDARWGLNDVGRQQAAAAGLELAQMLGSHEPAALLVLASPFSRTVETAVEVGTALGIGKADPRLQLEPALRERCFGSHEMTSCANYAVVWAEDALATCNRPPGLNGESVEDVAARTTSLVQQLEQQHSGRHIVLVSHGDALSILAAALLSTPLGQHRQHGLPNCGVLRIPSC
ncbi:Agropine synthesis reductase [Chlorella vulgaris]